MFFADFAQEALERYLVERQELLTSLQDESPPPLHINQTALFLNCRGGALTTQGIRYIIERYTALLPNYKKLTPHAFRHSFASMFITRGADIRIVQELLGHSNIATTQRYTHITAAQLQELYHKAHPHG